MKCNKQFLLLVFFLGLGEIFATGSNGYALQYIENKGQWESQILFKADISGGALFLERDRITFNIHEPRHIHVQNPDSPDKLYKGHAFNMQFLNANPNPQIAKNNISSDYYNYFLGDDPTKWQGNCYAYSEIVYSEIYPNIDFKISSFSGKPKYSFLLKKGANPKDIKLKYNGLDSVWKDADGNIQSKISLGTSTDLKPISYLISGDNQFSILSGFRLENNIVSFDIQNVVLNEAQTLEIDPLIVFSSYSGSTADNFGATATYDFYGNVYGSGLVFGTGYPTTLGAYQTAFNGSSDIAITKFNATGSARIYSTYLGGSSYDVPHSLIVDQNSRLIVLGSTSSTNYPTTANAYDRTHNGGPNINLLSGLGVRFPNGADMVLTKFNAAGNALLGSTYFGGNGSDGVIDFGQSGTILINYGDNFRGEVMVDSSDNVYVSSTSTSTNLPMLTNSYQKTNAGGYDGILAKFSPNLTSLLGSTYMGGSGNDVLYDMTFDNAYNIVAAGGTVSRNFPTTAGAFSTTYGDSTDGVVVSFDNFLSTLRFSSYYGTTAYDQIYFVEVDKANQIYVFGQTAYSASNFYILNATYNLGNTGQFVSIFNPTMTARVRSTTIGRGNQDPDISPTAFLVDYCSKIFIAGWGTPLGTFNTYNLSTTGLPVTPNAIQPTSTGRGFYLMVLEGNMSGINYGTFFGGTTSVSEEHVDGGTSRFDKNGIVYHAVCSGCGGNSNLPIYPSVSQVVAGTNLSPNCNLGVFKLDFGLPVKANFSTSSGCAPINVQFTNLSHIVSSKVRYHWDFGNGDTSNLANPSERYTTAGLYTVRLIVADDSSCNLVDTITKQVLILGLALDTLPTKYVCTGNSVRIGYANVTDTALHLVWTPAATVDDPSILAPYASPTATTTYRVIITKGTCVDTFYQKVIVEMPKTLTITALNNCSGAKVTAVANFRDSGTYSWTPAASLVSQNKDTAVFNLSGTTTLTLNYLSLGGCVSTATKSITPQNTQVKLIGDSIVCAGEKLNFVGRANVAGGTFTFLPTNKIVSQSDSVAQMYMDSSRWIVVHYQKSAGCVGSDSIYVSLLKDKISWKTDSVLCPNVQAIATANISNAYTVNWQPSALLATAQNTSPAKFNLNNTDTKIYINAALNARSTCQFHDSANIHFIQNNIKLSADTTRCRDSNVTIYTVALSGVSYQWTPANLLISANANSTKFKTTTSQYYYLKATDSSGCVVVDSIHIQIINDLIKTTGDASGCVGDSFRLQTTLMSGATYQWYPAVNILQGATAAQAVGILKGAQVFYVNISDTNGCNITDSVKIAGLDSTHYLAPDFSYNSFCKGNASQFTNLTQNTTATTNYLWKFGDGDTSTQKNGLHTYLNSGNFTVTLIVSDTAKCNKIDSVAKQIPLLNNWSLTNPVLKSCKNTPTIISYSGGSVDSIRWKPIYHIASPDSLKTLVSPAVDTVYTAYIYIGGCVDTLRQHIDIDTAKPLKIHGDTAICVFSADAYTATHYDSGAYIWTPAVQLLAQNRDSATFYLNALPTKIKSIYTSEYQCVSSDSLIIKQALTTLNLSSDSVFCAGDTLTINSSFQPKGGNLVFSPNFSIVSTTDSTTKMIVDTTRTITGTYTISPQCRATATLNISLLKDKVKWTLDSIVCPNAQAVATANVSSLYTINWQPSALLTTVQNTSPAKFSLNNTDQKIYINATLTKRNTCQFHDSAKVHFIQNNIGLTADTTRCRDSNVTITANALGGVSYQWTPANLLISANGNSAKFKTTTSQYYYVKATDTSGCVVMDSIHIQIINDLIHTTGDALGCVGDTFHVQTTQMAGASYQWFPAVNIVQGATTAKATGILKKAQVFYVTIADTNGCNITDSVRLDTLGAAHYLVPDFSTKIVCKGSTSLFTNLTQNTTANTNYVWKFGDGDTAKTFNANHIYTNGGNFSVTLIVSDTAKCHKIDSVSKLIPVLNNWSLTEPVVKSCRNTPVTIGYSGASVDSIHWRPLYHITNPDSLKSLVSPAVDTVYTAFVFSGGCVDTFKQPIDIDTARPLKIHGDTALCAYSANAYTATHYDSGAYVWTPATNLTYQNRDSATFYLNALPTQIKSTYTSEYQCISSDSLAIKQVPTTLTLTGDSVFCAGDTLTVSGSFQPKRGSLMFSPSALILSTTDTTAKMRIDTTRTITGTYTISPQCRATATLPISLLKDKVKWAVDTVICPNVQAVATANISNVYTINWQPSALLTTAQNTSPAKFNLNNNDQKIYLNATLNKRNTCQFHDSAKVHFIQNNIGLNADTTRCRDSNVTIYTNALAGVSYQWTPANLLISANGNSAKFKTTTSRYYYLKATDTSGCVVLDSIFVRIINDFIKTTGDASGCVGDTFRLQTTQMAGATYQWYPAINILNGANTSKAVGILKNSQTFYVNISDTNGCVITDSVKISGLDSTHYLVPKFTTNAVCKGSSANFVNTTQNTTSTTNYLWKFGDGDTAHTFNAKHTYANSGSFTITLIVSDTSKCHKIDSVSKLIPVSTNWTLTQPLVKACKNTPVTIGYSGTSVDSIRWKPLYRITNPDSLKPIVSPSVDTVYTATIFSGNCVDTVIQLVDIDTVKPLKLHGDTAVCLNAQKSYTATKYDSGAYVWTPAVNLLFQKRDSSVFFLSSFPTKIKIVYTSDYQCVSADSLTIKRTQAALALTADTLGCRGDTIQISAKYSPLGGILSFSPTAQILSKTDSSATMILDTSRIFTATYTVSPSCLAAVSVPVHLLKDNVSWAVDSFICYGNNAIATANISNAYTINWQPSALLTTSQNTSPAQFNLNKTDQKIYINATLNKRSTCQFHDSAQIRFIQNALKLTADSFACRVNGIWVKASHITNATYAWFPQANLITTSGDSAYFRVDSSRYYVLEVSDNKGCVVRDSVYVRSLDDAIRITGDSTACPNTTLQLHATNTGTGSYAWTPTANILTGANTPDITANISQTTLFILQYTNSSRSCSVYDSIWVHTLDKNNFYIATTDTVNCYFDTLELVATYLPNVAYTWRPVFSGFKGVNTNVLRGYLKYNWTFIVRGVLANGACAVEDTISILKDTNYLKIQRQPYACSDTDTVSISVNERSNFSYDWSPKNWILNKDTLAKYLVDTNIYYKCTATTNPAGVCIYSDSVKIIRDHLLDGFEATATPSRITRNASSQLLATTNNAVFYRWAPDTSLNIATVKNPIAKPIITTIYTATVMDKLGCKLSDTAEVFVDYEFCGMPEVFVPTGFTPNGDGRNDILYVRGDNITQVQFQVYDRWGQLVFETNRQDVGWDGKFKGVELEPTVFAYTLWVQCIGGATYSTAGNVTLIK